MQLTIESVRGTKSGKGYMVKANGVDYFSKAPGIEQAQGKVVDAEVGQFNGQRGVMKTIESFSVSSNAPADSGGMPWWWPSVSNVWAHAIQSGHIVPGEKPVTEQLINWAKAVKAAAEYVTRKEEVSDDPFE